MMPAAPGGAPVAHGRLGTRCLRRACLGLLLALAVAGCGSDPEAWTPRPGGPPAAGGVDVARSRPADPDECMKACLLQGTPRADCRQRCLGEVPGAAGDPDQCMESCLGRGAERAQCRETCLPGLPPAGAAPAEAARPVTASMPAGAGLTSGHFRCPSCARAHRWEIANGVLYWNGAPYVPVAGFRTSLRDLPRLTGVNVWVDRDHVAAGRSEAQYLEHLDRLTREITERGGTYVLVIGYPGPSNQQAARLLDPQEIARITGTWRRMAPALSKDGLRALLLFGEINWEWTWSPRHRPEEYGAALGSLARQAQAIFGEVPVLFKTVGTGGGAPNVLAAALRASGLGADVFPQSCTGSTVDPRWEQELTTIAGWRLPGDRLLWATDWSRGAGEAAAARGYWKAWPPFRSKAEMECVLLRLIAAGVTGFIYNGPESPEYDESYRWYGELREQIIHRVLTRPR